MAPGADDRLRIEDAQRDPSRFGELYEENFYRVYAYIARRVRGRQEAEDLTADVFREALAGLGRFEWRGAPGVAGVVRGGPRGGARRLWRGCCGLPRVPSRTTTSDPVANRGSRWKKSNLSSRRRSNGTSSCFSSWTGCRTPRRVSFVCDSWSRGPSGRLRRCWDGARAP